MAEFYYLFVKNQHAIILPESEVTFELEQKLLKKGYEIVWDSAPTIEKAEEYALNELDQAAWTTKDAPHGVCRICNLAPATGIYAGRVYSYYTDSIRYYRGYVCEQCANSFEDGKWIK